MANDRRWVNIEVKLEVMVDCTHGSVTDEELLEIIQSKCQWVGFNGRREVAEHIEVDDRGDDEDLGGDRNGEGLTNWEVIDE